MSPLQGKIAVLVMVEAPDQPVVGIVATTTVHAESFFVDIILGMTILTAAFLDLEGQLFVTALATGRRMLADQRKIRQVMVETQIFIPRLLAMTVLALPAQFLFMHILVPVTGQTVGWRLVPRFSRLMAGFTTGLPMRAAQGEIGFPVMIEVRLQPTLFIVALVTALAIGTFVHIIQLVTCQALARLSPLRLVTVNLDLLITLVTSMASYLAVLSPETEASQAIMIESSLTPLLLAVAVLAALSKTAAVYILDGMTGNTLGRRILVAVADMTQVTGHILV